MRVRTTLARRLAALALAVGLVLPLVAVRPTAAQAREFRIGVAVALSGIFGRDGTLLKEAYELWAEAVNERGGIESRGGRYPVRLIVYDDESSEAKSAQLVERLATVDRVDLLLGGFGSNVVFASTAVAEKYKYPYCSGAASANPIFERGFKFTFATLNKTFEEVRAVAEVFVNARPKPQTAAIIGAEHLFAKLSAEGFRKVLQDHGVRVVHFEIFPLALADYTSLLQKVKRRNPEVLLVGSLLAHSLRVMKAAKEVGYAPKGVGFSFGPTVPDFVKELGRDAEYAVGASEWVPSLYYRDPVFGTSRTWYERFRLKYRKEPDYTQVAATACAVAQQVAVQNLNLVPPLSAEDRERLAEEMHRLDFQSLYGRVKFGPDGAIVLKPPLAVQIQDGRGVLVWPKLQGAKPLRYPMPPWDRR